MNERLSPFFLMIGDENLQRGIMLREQHRYADAESYLAKALEAHPDHTLVHFQLALCYIDWGNHDKAALRHIDRAIALDPHVADFFAVKGVLMGNMNKHRDAARLADEALALEPELVSALNVKTRTFSAQSKWREMEASARRTLEADITNEPAANFLAFALRQQGRRAEGDQVISDLLARVPDDAWAQANAGWSALEAGNHHLANGHFLTALRLQPDYDHAREGLLHSINSRVWIYRFYFRLNSLFSRFDMGSRISILFFIFLLFHYSGRFLHLYFGHLGGEVLWFLLLAYFFVFACGREFGNLFLLLHPFARHALTKSDKVWACVSVLAFAWFFYSSIQLHMWTGIVFLPFLAACFLVTMLTTVKEATS